MNNITHNTVTGIKRETDFSKYFGCTSRVSLADSYKYSHAKQYPGMNSMFDYISSRGGFYPKTIVAGGQIYTKGYFGTPIEQWEVDEAYADAQAHGVPFDIEGWDYIVQTLKGKLPVRIKSIEEGKLIPTNMVLMTFESTDKKVPWVAGWKETVYMKTWYPTTVATKSYYIKQMISKIVLQQHTHNFTDVPDGRPKYEKYNKNDGVDYFAQLTDSQKMVVSFMYHNFGDRGSTSVESAEIGGFAHSTQFLGTDNFNSLRFVRYIYNNPNITSWSVFATEHSTTTANADGCQKKEEAFVIRMLEENPLAPIMSFVADSYDVYKFTHFATVKGGKIRTIIEERENQKFVLRPDSGDALEVVSKMLDIMVENEVVFIMNELLKLFTNYAILWGDGIIPETIEDILIMVVQKGFAAENMVFGSGGDIMQNVNRDTQRFAMKCSSITRPDGTEQDVFKNPITDPGKASKKGRITTYQRKDGTFYVARIGEKESSNDKDMLVTIFEDGEIVREFTMEEIRANS